MHAGGGIAATRGLLVMPNKGFDVGAQRPQQGAVLRRPDGVDLLASRCQLPGSAPLSAGGLPVAFTNKQYSLFPGLLAAAVPAAGVVYVPCTVHGKVWGAA